MSEGRRVKRWAPKVFSGCQTCKRRRIKCDETKPQCNRCARSGLRCEGYLPPATRMFDPNKKASDSSQSSEQSQQKLGLRSPTNRSTPSPGAAAVAFTTPEEQLSFDFFTQKTADLISVYSHRPFWKEVLPQATQQHAAVKHSVLALAILHQSLSDEGCLSDENSERLFTHYNTAIRSITQGQPPIDIVLMTCVLFWAIENFSGSGREPYHHVEAAVKILDEFKSKEENKTNLKWTVITDHIEPALKSAHIHITYNQLEDLTVRQVQMLDTYGILAHGPPKSFPNLQSATEHLRQCIRCLLRVFNDTAAEARQVKADLAIIESHLCRWLGLFHTITAAAEPTDRRMLVLHHISATMLCVALKETLGEHEAEVANSKSRALWITHEIEDITNTPLMAKSGAGSSSKVLSHDLGIIPPLFVVATVCEDLALKAQALVLLKKMDRVEGLWKSCAAAKIAEIVIEMRAKDKDAFQLYDLLLGTGTIGLTLQKVKTGESVECPIWEMLKEVEEVDLDALTNVVHNYGYQIEVTN